MYCVNTGKKNHSEIQTNGGFRVKSLIRDGDLRYLQMQPTSASQLTVTARNGYFLFANKTGQKVLRLKATEAQLIHD